MRHVTRLSMGAVAAVATLLGAPAALGANPIPVLPSAAPVGTGGSNGVQPGSLVESGGGLCTMNFVFRGTQAQRYIGTAGHCAIGEGSFSGDAGERSWRRGRGPVARDAEGKRIGRFAYAVLRGERDFALIRLDRRVNPNPQMRHFGGPTGVYTERSPGGVLLNHYGLGIGVGDVVPARSMTALNTLDPDEIFGQGLVVPGDSGGPVILAGDGRAVGLTVTTGIHTRPSDFGTVGITRIDPQRDRAAKVLDSKLKLLRAPLR